MNQEEIVHAALGRSRPEEREAFLEQACAGNPALRASVEALLRASVGASGFKDRPAPGLIATIGETISEQPGTVIGPYKLLEQIGEGGMGLVFVAEQQQPVRRKVALKVIKPGMDTRQVVARFEAERQALAVMDHPNIAKVHDGGQTSSGRPYFVMELVKGVPITDYCDENRLPPSERLELFLHVCQAVQHAHQKGIIHRDLKPSNVLVASHDGVPVVKIIDFGVAKAVGQQLTERTVYTQFTQLIGTPLYMSPEQAGQSALDVDTRSDIYSLGVLLYELLTGTTPFDQARFKKAGYDEIRRIIREEEPPKPSTRMSTVNQAATTASTKRQSDPRKLRRLFRGELDWIVMKALEKDRNRRYETASAFAADVQRYLKDEAVQACPPSATYRLRKFVGRHRLALAVATAAAAVLLVVVVALTVSNSMIRAEQEQTRREFERAEKQRAQAEAVIKYLTVDLLGEASPEQNSRDKQVTVEQLLDRAAKKIENNPQMADQPEVEATIRLTIGDTYFKLGVLPEAEKHLRRAVELRRAALGLEHPDTLTAQETLAWFLVGGLRRAADAEPLSRQTWEARRRVLGPEHADTLDSMDTYASVLISLNRLDEAEVLDRQCWETRRRVLGPEHAQTLTSQGNLASVLGEQGKWADVELLSREAQEIHRRLGRMETESGLSNVNNLAFALLMLDKVGEAEQLLREAAEAASRRHGAKHPYTLQLQHVLSRVLFEQRRYKDADALGRETLRLRREVLPAGHERVGRSVLLLGAIAVEAKRPTEAEPLLREALTLFRERYPAKQDLIGEAESWLGACLDAQHRPEEAEPLLVAGYDKMAAARGVGPKQRERALGYVVQLYETWNKPEQAARWKAKQQTPASGAEKPVR